MYNLETDEWNLNFKSFQIVLNEPGIELSIDQTYDQIVMMYEKIIEKISFDFQKWVFLMNALYDSSFKLLQCPKNNQIRELYFACLICSTNR